MPIKAPREWLAFPFSFPPLTLSLPSFSAGLPLARSTYPPDPSPTNIVNRPMIGGQLLHSVYAALVDYCFPNGGLSNLDARPLISPADVLTIPLLHLLAIHLLLRYPRHRLSRALRQFVLLPLTLASGLRVAFGLTLEGQECTRGPSGVPRWGGKQQTKISVGIYLLCYSVIKMVEWSFYPTPRLQEPLVEVERRLALQRRGSSAADRTANGGKGNGTARNEEEGADDEAPTTLPIFYPGTMIPLELDLLCNVRGLGWDWGPRLSGTADCPLPTPLALVSSSADSPTAIKQWRAARIQWLRARLRFLLVTYIFLDLVDSLHKSEVLWGLSAGEGAPVIDGVVAREGLDLGSVSVGARLVLTVTTGVFSPNAMALWPSLLSVLAVLPTTVLPPNSALMRAWQRHIFCDPAHWSPTIIDRRVWRVGSCRRLWGAHWHQVLRRCFMVGAYWPVKAGAGWVVEMVSGDKAWREVDGEKDGNGNVVSDDGSACCAETGGQARSQSNGLRRRQHQQGKSTAADERPNSDHNLRSRPDQKSRRTKTKTTMAIHALASVSTFVLSGLIHEIILLVMARDPAERSPWRIIGLGPEIPTLTGALTAFSNNRGKGDRGGGVLLFFTLQGLACVGEEMVEQWTGWEVGGVWGSVWTMAFLVLTSFPFAKTWWYLGMTNGPQFTPFSPYTRRLIDWGSTSSTRQK
ncbi:hypothetical protein V8E36_002546 [Tilletia maclaganii]